MTWATSPCEPGHVLVKNCAKLSGGIEHAKKQPKYEHADDALVCGAPRG